HGSGRDVLHQLAKEGLVLEVGVVLLGHRGLQAAHGQAGDLEALALHAGQHFPDEAPLHAFRLHHHKRPLHVSFNLPMASSASFRFRLRLGFEWLHRSEEHTSELQSRENLVCRLLLEKKNQKCYAKPLTETTPCPSNSTTT